MTFYAYGLSPIDFGWEFLPTVEEMASRFAKHDALLAIHDEKFEEPLLPKFMQYFEMAKARAREVGWEGDYRGSASPRVIFLPSEEMSGFVHAFVWKQGNNGSTFVVSHYPMPWLQES